MATVVSVSEIGKRFTALGWTNLSTSDVLDWLKANSVAAASLVAYLDAAIAAPAGFNDQTIAGCTASDASKITAALKAKGVETV